MPYQIKYERPPAGYAASSSRKGEKNVQVVYREFLTSEDGMLLIKRLEGFATQVINMIYEESQIGPSCVDHMLVHFDQHGRGLAYINELDISAKARLKKSVDKGDALYRDDIVGYEEIRFQGVDVPDDHAVMVILSSGWRKLLYFDFGTIHSEVSGRNYDLWSMLGNLYNYLMFQEVLSLSSDSWELLISNGWFPFVGIGSKNFDSLMAWLREGSSGDEVLPAVYSELTERLPGMLKAWQASEIFEDHVPFLTSAVNRFKEEDWISCNSILYPRIEGVLRALAKTTNSPNYGQSELSSATQKLAGERLGELSRILPHKFNDYLRDVYFKNFNPENPVELSRHSVGHGVAPADSFNQKAATIGMLIVEQIFYHLPPKPKYGAFKS